VAGKKKHRSFGYIRRLPSKRYQASYIGPDLVRYNAPSTFDAKDDAVAWLAAERKLVESGVWRSPAERRSAYDAKTLTLAAYATAWLAERQLKPRTAEHYRRLLERFVVPTLGAIRIAALTPAIIRTWYAALDASAPTQRAHTYALVKAICKTAVDDELLAANPCRIAGAGQTKRASRTTPASPVELEALIVAIPQRYKAMILLASWCAMRLGELTELRRSDLDLKNDIVRVRRAVTWVAGQPVVGTTKSDAGTRNVAIPPHVVPQLRQHLAEMPMTGRDALLFPSTQDAAKQMRPATLYKVYYRAREAAGRPDLRFHDLRHTGAVYATMAGASLPEVMARLGHSTPAAAMRYQHAARGRDAEIANALSKMAGGSA
jgi:integrase